MKMVKTKTTMPTRLSKTHRIDLVEFVITFCRVGDKIGAQLYPGDKVNDIEYSSDIKNYCMEEQYDGVFFIKKENEDEVEFCKIDHETEDFYKIFFKEHIEKKDVVYYSHENHYDVYYEVVKDFYIVTFNNNISLDVDNHYTFKEELSNSGITKEMEENDLPAMLRDVETELSETIKEFKKLDFGCECIVVPTLWQFETDGYGHWMECSDGDSWFEYVEIFDFEKLMAKKDAV